MHLLTPEEEAWIRGGGRLVLAVAGPYATLSTHHVDSADPRKVFPLWPGVEHLQPPERRSLAGGALDGAHAVFAGDRGASVAFRREGKGEVVLLSCPEVFQNGFLGKADHLALLGRLAGEARPVVFDEFVHGVEIQTGALEILRHWGLGPFLLMALLAALAVAWRGRVRTGPPEDDARETRVEAVDLLDSLALLYRRTLPRRQALSLYAKAFQQDVSIRTGLRGPALEARVKELLGRPLVLATPKGKDLAPAAFQLELMKINNAFGRLEDAKRDRSRRAPATLRRRA